MELSKEQMEKVIYELECNYNSKIFDDENLIIIINLFKDYLNKGSDLNKVKDKITIKTRQYAKRQSTWARGQMKNWQKVNPKALNQILKKL